MDGHNRQSLCEKHGIPYNMAVFAFDDLLEAKQWALDTQKGRRNLDKWELGKIALKLKPEIEAKAKANMSCRRAGIPTHPRKVRQHCRTFLLLIPAKNWRTPLAWVSAPWAR